MKKKSFQNRCGSAKKMRRKIRGAWPKPNISRLCPKNRTCAS